MDARDDRGQPDQHRQAAEIRHRRLLHLERARVVDDAGAGRELHRDRRRSQRHEQRDDDGDHGHVSTCDGVPRCTSIRAAFVKPQRS